MTTIIPATEGLQAQDIIAYVESGGSQDFVLAVEDPSVIASRIDAEILAASSIDVLLGGSEVTHARDYLNRPFTLTDVTFRQSTIEGSEGLPFFCVLTGVNLDGEILKISTGARSIMLKVAKIKAENWFPANVKLVEGGKTASGYTPLDLVAGVITEPF